MISTNQVTINFTDRLHSDLMAAELIDCVGEYFNNISSQGAVPILSIEHMANIVGIQPRYLGAVSNSSEKFYRRLIVRKRNLSTRVLHEPLPLLKELQKWILINILDSQNSHVAVKSYKKGISIKDNARFHVKKNIVLKYDLKDFFGHVNFSMVRSVFYRIGYTKSVSNLLAKLCMNRNCLPQGAPTSGAISNLVLYEFDVTAFDYFRRHSLNYTRYADDITISGDIKNIGEIETFLKDITKRHGFILNNDKTSILRKNNRQKVTGIVVNEKLEHFPITPCRNRPQKSSSGTLQD